MRDRDPARESWDGRRAGPAGAVRTYGADDAFPITDVDEILPGLLENRTKVYYTMGAYPEFDQRIVGWVNGLRSQSKPGRVLPPEFVSLAHVLHDMRLFKSRNEVDLMRESARIAARGHIRAMKACRPGRRASAPITALICGSPSIRPARPAARRMSAPVPNAATRCCTTTR